MGREEAATCRQPLGERGRPGPHAEGQGAGDSAWDSGAPGRGAGGQRREEALPSRRSGKQVVPSSRSQMIKARGGKMGKLQAHETVQRKPCTLLFF